MKKLAAIILWFTLANVAQAIPLLINYQGVYVNNAGVPVTQSSVPVTISIWNHATFTGPAYRLYQEDHTVNINDGQFSLQIGSGSNPTGTFNANTFNNSNTIYLQLSINSEDMSPRVRFLSAPYTFQAENSVRFNNQPPSYYEEKMCRTTIGNIWIASLNLCVGGSVNLSGIDLTSQQLAGVRLNGAAVNTTDLDNANLQGAFLKNLVYTPSKPPSIENANFSGATITDSPMVNINLSTAGSLTGLYANGLTSCPLEMPASWVCVSAVANDDNTPPLRLIGPGARFSDDEQLPPATWYKTPFPTNLSGVNFRFNYFDQCNFQTNTNFTNANLFGAHFSGGSPSQAIWDNTVCPDGTNSNDNDNTCVGKGL